MQTKSEITRRGRWFLASAIVYGCLMIICLIVIPIALASETFFTVYNRSNYVEIANVFDNIQLYLQGHCIRYVDKSFSCRKLSLPEMFFRFPDYSAIPSNVTPADIPNLFSIIPGQNNYVFLPLLVAEFVALWGLIMGWRAYKSTSRRSIMLACIPSFILMVILAVCVGVSNLIYGNMLPQMLNK